MKRDGSRQFVSGIRDVFRVATDLALENLDVLRSSYPSNYNSDYSTSVVDFVTDFSTQVSVENYPAEVPDGAYSSDALWDVFW